MNLFKQDTLSVDPGWNTGWADWKYSDKANPFPDVGIFKLPPKIEKTFEERLIYMLDRFHGLLKTKNPKLLIIEGTEVWNSALGNAAATKKTKLGFSPVIQLSVLVGGYCAIAIGEVINFKIVSPAGKDGWKGQMNDEVIAARIKRINGQTYPEHIREAVGLGFAMSNIKGGL